MAVRGLRVVEGSHCYSQASDPSSHTRQMTNAKGRERIIIQVSRSGEVDQMNIEDSCRPFLCFAKYDVGRTYFFVMFGGKKGSEQLRFCLGGRRRAILESEGAAFLVGHWPPVRHLSANFLILSPFPIFIMRFSTILRFYYDLDSTFICNK